MVFGKIMAETAHRKTQEKRQASLVRKTLRVAIHSLPTVFLVVWKILWTNSSATRRKNSPLPGLLFVKAPSVSVDGL